MKATTKQLRAEWKEKRGFKHGNQDREVAVLRAIIRGKKFTWRDGSKKIAFNNGVVTVNNEIILEVQP